MEVYCFCGLSIRFYRYFVIKVEYNNNGGIFTRNEQFRRGAAEQRDMIENVAADT